MVVYVVIYYVMIVFDIMNEPITQKNNQPTQLYEGHRYLNNHEATLGCPMVVVVVFYHGSMAVRSWLQVKVHVQSAEY